MRMKKCRATRVGLWVFLAGFAGASISSGTQDPDMILGSPSVSSNALVFTLNAQSGVSYTIQASSNLLDWVAVGTNADPGITRTITISNPPDGPSYYRAARGPLPLFGFALAAKGLITIAVGGVDSFDGSLGPWTPAMARANATVLTDTNTAGAISLVAVGYIHGNAVTGPGGTVTVSGGSSVSGTITHDANIEIHDVAAPTFSTFSTSLSGGTVNGTNYTYIATNGNYKLTNLNVSSGQSMVVNGNVVIYCTSVANNCVSVGGSGFIYITPGSSLTLYIAGPSTITGVVNGSQPANTCIIYGLPTCRAMGFSGGASFTGVLDAPEADVTLSGAAIWSGAVIVSSIYMSNNGGFHYDENLARVGPTR